MEMDIPGKIIFSFIFVGLGIILVACVISAVYSIFDLTFNSPYKKKKKKELSLEQFIIVFREVSFKEQEELIKKLRGN